MRLTEINGGSFYKRSDGYYGVNIRGINEENQVIEVVMPKTKLTTSSTFSSNGLVFNVGIQSTFKSERVEPLTVYIIDDGDENGTNQTG